MKRNTCCFTGHRPQKLPWGFDEACAACTALKELLVREITAMADQGVNSFISGMALGTDLWCAEIVCGLKKQRREITLIAAVPFEGQANRWNSGWRERYYNVLAKADEEWLVSAHYTPACMLERNRRMVDASRHILAVYGGGPGGTQSTLAYARQKGLALVTIDPNRMAIHKEPALRGLKLLQ